MANAEAHLRKDKKLTKVVDSLGPHAIKTRRTKFESLVRAIITQQISGSAARSIMLRFRKAYHPARFPKPANVATSSYKKLKKMWPLRYEDTIHQKKMLKKSSRCSASKMV